MDLARRYADFLGELEWARLPQEVRAIAVELFADWFANAAAGFDSPLARALRSVGPARDSAAGAILIGDLQPADPLWAAMVNAGASHANEFDDSYRAGLYHPGAPVQSAAFSAACLGGASGERLLCALVGGYEVSLRLAQAINPAHYRIWHTTGTVGAFGAAAAATYVLALDPDCAAGAFGLAGTQAAGLWEVLPDAPHAKNLHPAKAAHAGLLAALLSRSGVTGPPTIFEGRRGFFAATVPEPVDLSTCTADLGRHWLTLETTFKAYPTCGHAMTAIEACLQLHGQVAVEAVEQVEVRAHPVSIEIAGEPLPQDEAQAKFSIPYCVAVALLYGRVGQFEFSPAVMADPRVTNLLQRIRLVADDTLGKSPGQRPARVTVRTRAGESISAAADVRKGDPELPMTAAEKRAKVAGLLGQVWRGDAAERIASALARIAAAADVREWAGQLRGVVAR